MSIPSGATQARYHFVLYQDGPPTWVDTSFTVVLPVSPEPVAAAGETAMNTLLAELETAYPGATITASRSYDCVVAGDTWPTP